MSKAKRAKISLTASLVVDGWMYNNMYMMSGTDATRVVKKRRFSVAEFVSSKAAYVLSDKDKIAAEIDNPEGGKLTLYTTKCIFAYWNYQSHKGNSYAYALTCALGQDSLDRLYDIAFQGEQKSEQDYKQQRDDTRDEMLQKLMAARHDCRLARCTIIQPTMRTIGSR